MSLFKKSNDEDNDLLDEREIPKLIKDDKVPVIKDHNGFAIFTREYENRRIVVSNYILKTLVNNNQLQGIIDYFKNKNVIDYISFYRQQAQATVMVNMYLYKEDTYLVPIHLDGDDTIEEDFDDTIFYSENAKRICKDESIDVTNIKEMIFCPVKDPKDGSEYLPLFNSVEEVRSIFPIEDFRIARISYKEATEVAIRYLGLVFRPTEENYIILNNIASLFLSVSKPMRLCTDYKKYTENEKTIEDKIKRLHNIKPNKPEFNLYFRGILQSICDIDKIYIALSRKSFDQKTATALPIVTNKDGNPSIYIFTDIEVAKKWIARYDNYLPGGIPLLGEVHRKDGFDSLFAIASKMGPNLCTLNDSGAFFVFNVKLFMEINNLSPVIKLRVPKVEAEKFMLNKSKSHISINYNRIHILAMSNLVDRTEYGELEFK